MQPQSQTNNQGYQPSLLQNKNSIAITLTSLKNYNIQRKTFTQISNTAESLQMTMNPYLKERSSTTSYKPLMVFIVTDPEYWIENTYLQLPRM